MIQRIQSLYLTFIFILCLILLKGPILNFVGESGTPVKLLAGGMLFESGQKLMIRVVPAWPLTTLLASTCLVSIAALFMFRNRRLQMLLTIVVIVLSVLLTGDFIWLGFHVIQDYKMTFSPGLKMVFPALILIFSILAYLGIKKDDRLVKSYDRLR
jgi:hypothetical protein